MHAVCLLTWPYKSLQCSGEHAPRLLASTRLGFIFKSAIQSSGRSSSSFSLESNSVWNPAEVSMKFQYKSTKSPIQQMEAVFWNCFSRIMHVFCNFAKTRPYNLVIFRWNCGTCYRPAGRTVSCDLGFIFLYCMVLAFWLWGSLADGYWLKECSGSLAAFLCGLQLTAALKTDFLRGEMLCSRKAEEGLNCKIYLCFLRALAKVEIVSGTAVHVENYLEYQ